MKHVNWTADNYLFERLKKSIINVMVFYLIIVKNSIGIH